LFIGIATIAGFGSGFSASAPLGLLFGRIVMKGKSANVAIPGPLALIWQNFWQFTLFKN
jgi:hypothetical protein